MQSLLKCRMRSSGRRPWDTAAQWPFPFLRFSVRTKGGCGEGAFSRASGRRASDSVGLPRNLLPVLDLRVGRGVLRAASPAVEPGVGFDRSGREPCRRLESFILILTRSLRRLLPQKAGLTFLWAYAPLVTATRDLGQAT